MRKVLAWIGVLFAITVGLEAQLPSIGVRVGTPLHQFEIDRYHALEADHNRLRTERYRLAAQPGSALAVAMLDAQEAALDRDWRDFANEIRVSHIFAHPLHRGSIPNIHMQPDTRPYQEKYQAGWFAPGFIFVNEGSAILPCAKDCE